MSDPYEPNENEFMTLFIDLANPTTTDGAIDDGADPNPETSFSGTVVGNGVNAQNFYREFSWFKHPKKILTAIELLAPSLPQTKRMDEWVRLIRQARHPNLLWRNDYIEASPVLEKINDHIRKSEILFFGSKTSCELVNNHECDANNLVLLNKIRAFLRAEEGAIEDSLKIWDHLYRNSLSSISVLRQTNLLFHLFTSYLCVGQYEKAISCFKKHWTLLRLQTDVSRYDLGIWDNEIVMHTIAYHFMFHDKDFEEYFKEAFGLYSVHMHKKVTFKDYISPSMVATMCSRPFYDHAKSRLPNLPDYDIGVKRTKKDIPKQVSIETLKVGISEGWDMWHEEIEEHDHSSKLVEFLTENDVNPNKVLDVCCGTSQEVFNFTEGKDVVRVDCSSHVEKYWEDKGISINKCLAEEYVTTTDETFDLIICSDGPQYISDAEDFILACSKIGDKICFLVACDEAGYWPVERGILQLVKTNENKKWWVDKIEKSFKILATRDDNMFLYVLAEKRKKN